MIDEPEAAGSILLVANLSARGGPEQVCADVVDWCVDHGLDPTIASPRTADRMVAEIRDALDEAEWRAVLSIGGDGTAGVCASAVAGSGVPMVIIPAGTGNSMFRAIWEDRPWVDVLDEALGPRAATAGTRVRSIDLLDVVGGTSATTRSSLLGCSAGMVAEILVASTGLTDVSGRDRYSEAIGPALENHQPFPGRVTVDGEPLAEGPMSLVAVGGARHRSGTFQLLPRSVLDDGLLDVCVVAGVDATGFVELAGAVMEGSHLSDPRVSYAQGSTVVVERTDGQPLIFESDGDVWDSPELSVTVTVSAVPVPMFAPGAPVAG